MLHNDLVLYSSLIIAGNGRHENEYVELDGSINAILLSVAVFLRLSCACLCVRESC